MRRIHGFLILLAGVFLLPALTWSQGPGSNRTGGFPQINPDDMFNKMSGGKDVIIVSELDQQKQMFFKMMGSRMGLTGDKITREQYREASTTMMNQFKAKMDAGGGGLFPKEGAAPSTPNPMGGPVVGSPGGMPPTREGRGDRGPPGAGGQDRTDNRAEEFFRRADRNSDGLLNFEEMSESLQRERDTYDTNKDGFIDLPEYKAYIAARFAAPKTDTPATPPMGTPEEKKTQPDGKIPAVPEHQPYKEDPRPTIFRAGKLPPGLPDWFIKLDQEGDFDGQVGLYEWKKSKKSLEEFMAMDLNGDGLLTAEEYLRWKGLQSTKKPADTVVAAETPGTSQDQRGPSRFGPMGGDTASPRFGPPSGGGDNNRGAGRFGPPQGSTDTGGQPRFGKGGNAGGGEGGQPRFGKGGNSEGGQPRFGKGGNFGGPPPAPGGDTGGQPRFGKGGGKLDFGSMFPKKN